MSGGFDPSTDTTHTTDTTDTLPFDDNGYIDEPWGWEDSGGDVTDETDILIDELGLEDYELDYSSLELAFDLQVDVDGTTYGISGDLTAEAIVEAYHDYESGDFAAIEAAFGLDITSYTLPTGS